MARKTGFENFVLDQLQDIGEFETKRMFGGLALLAHGSAFAKIKHGKVWLKVDEGNIVDFEMHEMQQYTYGKDNSRKLNFYETPMVIIEDRDKLKDWVHKSIKIAIGQ